jgi:hypothetical protein
MSCSICGQKSMNCDCTATERELNDRCIELESQLASLRDLELNEDLLHILGRPSFMCISVAQLLRFEGHVIETKAESEQAAVIHWMLTHYFANKDGWRDVVLSELERMHSKWQSKPETSTTLA